MAREMENDSGTRSVRVLRAEIREFAERNGLEPSARRI